VIVIIVPIAPDCGEKETIFIGLAIKPAKDAVPKDVVTDTGMIPLAMVPTVAVMVDSEMTVKGTEFSPKLTDAVLDKLVPWMATIVPKPPVVGVMKLIVGRLVNVNPPREPVPYLVVTDTFPETDAPTSAVIVLEDMTVKELAGTPPKLTAVAPVK
jgi:hypothetical protein